MPTTSTAAHLLNYIRQKVYTISLSSDISEHYQSTRVSNTTVYNLSDTHNKHNNNPDYPNKYNCVQLSLHAPTTTTSSSSLSLMSAPNNWDFFDTEQAFNTMTTDSHSDTLIPDGNSGSPTTNNRATDTSSDTLNLEGNSGSLPAENQDKSSASFTQNGTNLDTEEKSQAAVSFTSSQRTDIIHNKSGIRAPLQPIKENGDATKIIGVNLCVSNKMLDIHDYILFFLDTVTADVVYDYKQRQSSGIGKQELMHLMATPSEAIKLYTNFFGIQDEVPRDKHGNKLQGRRYAGFYLSSSQTYREMKLALWNRLGRREQMLKLGWYLNPYEDHETVQKIIAIIQGKNPSKGYPRGYANRIKACLKQQSEEYDFNLTIVSHNDKKSTGEKVFSYGIQIGRDQAKDLVIAMKSCPGKHFDGIYVKYKSDKKDFEAYDQALDNISQIPNTYTGIPVINLDATGAATLRQDLVQAAIGTYPIDVEATHLHQKFGKYMVTCPVVHVEEYRAKLTELLAQSDKYKSEAFPDPPQLQVRQFKRKAHSPPASVAEDPFGNLSVLADNSTVGTNYRKLRQQALDNLPSIGPTRSNLFAAIPTEIDMQPQTYAAAAGAVDDRSIGDSSLVSKISQLTDENSRLQQSIQSRDDTIKSMQQQLDEHVATTTQTVKELQDTKQQVHALQEDLKQSRLDHSNEIQRMLDSHQRDVQILQKNHDIKLQEHMEKAEKKHKEEVQAIQDEAQKTLQQSLQDFEKRFQQWTQQPPTAQPTVPPVSNKRSRNTDADLDTHLDMDHLDENSYQQVREAAMTDRIPSQQLQNLSLQASHETPTGHAS